MSLKRAVILSILSVNVLAAHSQAANDTIAIADTIWFEDGAWYIGQISDSLFNGFGKMVYADSTIYEGEWKNGLWDGKGDLYYPDGDRYSGQFRDHDFNGYGVYTYLDGAKYEGYWKDGMFNGAGSMTYADGSIYTGNWKDDMKDGIGVYYNAQNQTLLKGYFSDDHFRYPVSSKDETDTKETTNNTPVTAAKDNDSDRFHYRGQFLLGATFGTEHFIQLHADFYTSKNFFAGFALGFHSSSMRREGESSDYVDDDTGERVTLVKWDSYENEILTEKSYPMFKISGNLGFSWQRFSIGGAAGIALMNTIRNCRSLEDNDSYFEPGTYYYKEKVTGVKFSYDLFMDMVLIRQVRLFGPDTDLVYPDLVLRMGYGNIDGLLIGMALLF